VTTDRCPACNAAVPARAEWCTLCYAVLRVPETVPAAAARVESPSVALPSAPLAPDSVQTGRNGPDSPGGPVRIAGDLTITGTPDSDFAFDGLCSLTVGHDVKIVNRTVNFGIGFGDNCGGGELPNTVGHDLVLTNDSAVSSFFGPSPIEVGGNTVGHDLVFTHNTADPGGYLEVSDNQVAGNAICEANSPAVGSPEPSDGPNVVAGKNTCG